MYKICFLGYPKPEDGIIANGTARVVHDMALELEKRGYEISYYHLFSRSQYKNLYHYLEDNQIDIALWHMTSLKFKGKIKTPCPLICLWHSTPSFPSRHHSSKIYSVFHKVYNELAFTYLTRKANKLVLLSEGFKKDLLAAKIFPHKILAIHNMLYYQEVDVNFSQKEKHVIYVGRLRNEKQVNLLLRIWKSIYQDTEGWILDICGDGPERQALEQQAKDLALDNVLFHGFVDPKMYMSKAAIICMTSLYEGFPMTLLEAANYGCAPILFDSFASAKDVVTDEINGKLIPPFDEKLFATSLLRLMQDSEYRQKLAQNAMKDIQRFKPEYVIDKWEQLFKECINTKK